MGTDYRDKQYEYDENWELLRINDDYSDNLELIETEEQGEICDKKAEFHKIFNKLKESLTPREAKVLEMRFGFCRYYDGKQMSLEEVGIEFNCTKERIRQIEKKALLKLRVCSKEYQLFHTVFNCNGLSKKKFRRYQRAKKCETCGDLFMPNDGEDSLVCLRCTLKRECLNRIDFEEFSVERETGNAFLLKHNCGYQVEYKFESTEQPVCARCENMISAEAHENARAGKEQKEGSCCSDSQDNFNIRTFTLKFGNMDYRRVENRPLYEDFIRHMFKAGYFSETERDYALSLLPSPPKPSPPIGIEDVPFAGRAFKPVTFVDASGVRFSILGITENDKGRHLLFYGENNTNQDVILHAKVIHVDWKRSFSGGTLCRIKKNSSREYLYFLGSSFELRDNHRIVFSYEIRAGRLQLTLFKGKTMEIIYNYDEKFLKIEEKDH